MSGIAFGWIAAGRFTERVKELKYTTSMATAELQQGAVAELLATGGYALHLRRLKAALQSQQHIARCGAAVFSRRHGGTDPAGGIVLWAKLPAIDGQHRSTRTCSSSRGRKGSAPRRAIYSARARHSTIVCV